MDFSEALFYLKRGEKLTRRGWNRKGMYILMVSGTATVKLQPGTPYFDALGGFNGDAQSVNASIAPHIDLYVGQGEFQPGWLASQADLFATDWLLVL